MTIGNVLDRYKVLIFLDLTHEWPTAYDMRVFYTDLLWKITENLISSTKNDQEPIMLCYVHF